MPARFAPVLGRLGLTIDRHCDGIEGHFVPIGRWRMRKNFRVVQRTGMRNFRSFMGSMLTEREIWIGNFLAIRLPDNARLGSFTCEIGSTHR